MERILALRGRVYPTDLNHMGGVFGGWIMGKMDKAASITVEGLVIGQAATVFVTDLHFKEPVKNGDIFTIYTNIDSIGRTSIRIHVDFHVRRRETNCECSVVDAIFTFVTVDEAHNKIPVLEVLRHDVEPDILAMAHDGAVNPRYAKK